MDALSGGRAPAGETRPAPSGDGLRIEHVSMRYAVAGGPPVQALQNINLHIPTGQIVTVLGPSGCGKTTLLNIVAGYLAPTSGRVLLNGNVVRKPGPERGMVFQNGALFEWMNVEQNVGFGPRMRGLPSKQIASTVEHLLDVVGLYEFADKPVYALSGGMQQRVALARCLANDPDIIFMDEPLGALDALTRERMQGLILKLWREIGKTVVLITHSVEEALYLGERLIVLAPRPGRVHRDELLPFADEAVTGSISPREIKTDPRFIAKREEVLSMIWDMEEQIMGGGDGAG